jgi:Zn-dependent protease with chaperone function
MSALARTLFLAALPMAWAKTPAVTLDARMDATGEVTIRAWSSQRQYLAPVLAKVIGCPGGMMSGSDRFGEFHCAHALRREGLLLKAVLDLGPIARTLAATDEIEIILAYPRLGFEESSIPLKDQGARFNVVRGGRFTAGAAPGLLHIRFGYHLNQLTAIYVPLAAMALALTLVAMLLSRAGYADLNRSVFLLGTIFWLAAAARLQAAEPVRILLSGTPLANIAATLGEYGLPLLCVAAGAALGERKRARSEVFGEFFWSCGMFLFPLASAFGAISSMVEGEWIAAAPWLVFAPISIVVCRWRIRANAGGSLRELSGGELKDRVLQLAARTGRHDVRVFVSSSTRSQVMNAFALLRNGILMTAPLIQSLTRREVDAVAAHELSHFGHARRNAWAALAIAAVLFRPPLAEFLLEGAGLFLALLLPLIVFFTALHGARKREFAADAGSVALTGDSRAMIGALARISRHNGTPLDRNRVAEWFSTHPATQKRIRALAAAARLEPAEVEALCNTLCNDDDPGLCYTLPPADGDMIFTLAWQRANAVRYSWTALLGASVAGLLVAGLLDKFAGSGLPQMLAGIALGCAVTKVFASSVMSAGYARLGLKLARKLGAGGQLVGLAIDNEPRVYSGFRFSDTGFLSFQGGRLCYLSERTTILLNPADVLDVSMVAAAPSSWRRLQPMVRFRSGESPDVKAIILHPVSWGATPRRLFRAIARWRATSTSAESTSISGFTPVAGQPFHVPTLAQVARGFRIPGAVTLVGTCLAGWFIRLDLWPVWLALAITACAYTFMFLPAMLYRPSSLPPALTPPVDAG